MATRGIGSFTRSWAALAAWGAGLIELAVGAGIVVGADAGVAQRALGIALVTLGILTFAWGVVRIRRQSGFARRPALVGAAAGALALAATVLLSPGTAGVWTVVSGCGLLAGLAAAIVADLRGSSGTDRPDRSDGRVGAWGIVVGAVIVGGLVTPALGATEGGQIAVHPGDHSSMTDHH